MTTTLSILVTTEAGQPRLYWAQYHLKWSFIVTCLRVNVKSCHNNAVLPGKNVIIVARKEGNVIRIFVAYFGEISHKHLCEIFPK